MLIFAELSLQASVRFFIYSYAKFTMCITHGASHHTDSHVFVFVRSFFSIDIRTISKLTELICIPQCFQ